MEDLKDNIQPTAAPTDAELRRWQALSDDEQDRRAALAIRQGFESGVSSRSIDEIIRTGTITLAEEEAKVSKLKALIQQGLDDVDKGRVIQYDSPENATAAIMNKTT